MVRRRISYGLGGCAVLAGLASVALSGCERGRHEQAAHSAPAAQRHSGEPAQASTYWGESFNPADDDKDFAESYAMCRRVKGVAPPKADLPGDAAKTALKGCSSENLYYGLDGTKRDPVQARLCAFMEMGQTHDADDGFGGGTGVLMNIYANGDGTARDLDLATQMACRLDAAPAETDARVKHLQALKAQATPGKRFDFCDDITSGFAGGACASIAAGQAETERLAQRQTMTQGWSPTDQAALTDLQKAEEAFAEAHAGEQDLSGTIRYQAQVDAEEEVHKSSFDLLKSLSGGHSPQGSAADAAVADGELNSAYKKAMAVDYSDGGTLTAADIRTAQRAWLHYRDAWLQLARQKWPQVSSSGVAVVLIRDRVRQLSSDGQ